MLGRPFKDPGRAQGRSLRGNCLVESSSGCSRTRSPQGFSAGPPREAELGSISAGRPTFVMGRLNEACFLQAAAASTSAAAENLCWGGGGAEWHKEPVVFEEGQVFCWVTSKDDTRHSCLWCQRSRRCADFFGFPVVGGSKIRWRL